MCPDGTSVPRSGPHCEFAVCKQEIPSYMKEEPTSTNNSTSSETIAPFNTTSPLATIEKTTTKKTSSTNLFKKITGTASSLFQGTASNLGNTLSTGIIETKSTAPTPGQPQTPTTATNTTTQETLQSISEKRYNVVDNKILDEHNNIIYTLPATSANSSGSNLDTHVVNVIAVNHVAPVVGAIPVTGLPGKFYLSENSFGTVENCRFINKIYILDTIANTRTLLYEENNFTLSLDDPRACNNEMYLLATEDEKLILKYHTIGTNMVCDSTWSEPEKTWYLDVTKPENQTRRYVISPTLYSKAEESEAKCRADLETASTTTP